MVNNGKVNKGKAISPTSLDDIICILIPVSDRIENT